MLSDIKITQAVCWTESHPAGAILSPCCSRARPPSWHWPLHLLCVLHEWIWSSRGRLLAASNIVSCRSSQITGTLRLRRYRAVSTSAGILREAWIWEGSGLDAEENYSYWVDSFWHLSISDLLAICLYSKLLCYHSKLNTVVILNGWKINDWLFILTLKWLTFYFDTLLTFNLLTWPWWIASTSITAWIWECLFDILFVLYILFLGIYYTFNCAFNSFNRSVKHCICNYFPWFKIAFIKIYG